MKTAQTPDLTVAPLEIRLPQRAFLEDFMTRKNLMTYLIVLIPILGVASCDHLRDANAAHLREQRAIEREAEALSRGEATLAACIANKCEVLNLDGMKLDNYSVINDLQHVDVLMASRTNFSDLNEIAGMQHLVELHITSANVTDLSGLKNFPMLRVLHVEGTRPDVDKAPIAQLLNLTDLRMGNLDDSIDASFIQNMSKLENLHISWHGTDADISVLNGHPTLRNVEIGGQLPADQLVLLSMPKLETILFWRAGSLDEGIRKSLEDRGLLRLIPVAPVC